MSMRALVWLGSLALLMQAWIAGSWLRPVGAAAPPVATSPIPALSACASANGPEVIAELRIGDWSLSLRRSRSADTRTSQERPRVT
jgi:hypothetical protein